VDSSDCLISTESGFGETGSSKELCTSASTFSTVLCSSFGSCLSSFSDELSPAFALGIVGVKIDM